MELNKVKMIPCACGCGELIPEFNKWGKRRKYIAGHYWKGRKMSEEHKSNLSKSLIGKAHSKAHRKKISEANKNRHFSEEHKRKISEANKGKIFSEEHKRKISESNKDRIIEKHNENFKLKLIEERELPYLEPWKDPESLFCDKEFLEKPISEGGYGMKTRKCDEL